MNLDDITVIAVRMNGIFASLKRQNYFLRLQLEWSSVLKDRLVTPNKINI